MNRTDRPLTDEEMAEAVDDLVQRWHDGADPKSSLGDFLGLDEAEYNRWARDGELPIGYKLPDRGEPEYPPGPSDGTFPEPSRLIFAMLVLGAIACGIVWAVVATWGVATP